MIRSKAITKEQTDKILSLFNMHTCVEIANIVGVTLHQVYEVRKRYNLTNKQNQIFVFNDLQKQILLGGKLGDGNFKKMVQIIIIVKVMQKMKRNIFCGR